MLNLIKFIMENPDWQDKLSKKPYCITIKKKDNFLMFSYSQIDSDFYNPIVKECRGIILEKDTYEPVCVPFFKFGNYGEGYVDTIDWNTAKVQEKIDGSLIKLWNYNGEWHVSTNGTIDAKDAPLYSDCCDCKTYYDLFKIAASNSGLDIKKLNPDYTYMFELISPYNRMVVPYKTTEIIHLGTRNNLTLKECDVDIGIKKPKVYNFKSLKECIDMAKQLPFSKEGYVIVDKNWHRIKVKSPAYVAAHYLRNNGSVTKSRIVEIIKINEQDEFLTYFSEYTKDFNNIECKIKNFIEIMNSKYEYINKYLNGKTRKEIAQFAKTTICPPVLFALLDGKCSSVKEWLYNQSNDKIIKWVGD